MNYEFGIMNQAFLVIHNSLFLIQLISVQFNNSFKVLQDPMMQNPIELLVDAKRDHKCINSHSFCECCRKKHRSEDLSCGFRISPD